MFPPDAILGVDVDTYQPVDPLSRYGDPAVLEKLPAEAGTPLPADVLSLIAALHGNIALWTGSRGLLGRDHASHRTHVSAATPSVTADLITRYRAICANISSDTSLPALAADCFRLTQELAAVTPAPGVERKPGDATATRIARERAIAAATRLSTAHVDMVRRLVILRKIFGDDSPAEAMSVDAASREASFRYFRAVCLFADARTGRALLYDVETSLKRILLNLEDAMTTLHGPVDGNARGGTEPRGVEFRMRHVRKNWSAVEDVFRETVPYIAQTSLRAASNSADRPAVEAKSGGISKKYSVFATTPCLLGSVTKLELANPLSRRSRIRALHKMAARAYREINLVYDMHETIFKEALLVVQKRHEENLAATEELLATWERLLDSSPESSP